MQQATVFEKLIEPALPVLQEIERGRPKHGNEKLSWLQFVLILIYYFTKRCGSQASLVVALENADERLKLPKVPKMTLSEAFGRFPPRLLRHALSLLLARVDLAANPELRLLGHIWAGDASQFPVVGGLKLPADGEPAAKVKLHLLFSLTYMIAVDFILGEAESSERAALRKMLTAGVTYVLDRGYMAFDLYKAVVDAHAHVVMRVYSSIIVETIRENAVELPEYVKKLWFEVCDRVVCSGNADALGLEFRLVEFTVGSTRYRLMTDRFDLTTFQVILLFAYRWQIELSFRFFKHTMNGIEVITQSRWGMENFFLAMFLTAVLHLYFKIDCLEQAGYLPPTVEETVVEMNQHRIQTSADTTRPTATLAIACFMTSINQKLALFWKIPKHWLATLADFLHRPFSSTVVRILNKRALAPFNSS